MPSAKPGNVELFRELFGRQVEQIQSYTPEQLMGMAAYCRIHKAETFFPDVGPLRRELYAKHLEFFAAGLTRRTRMFLAGNRVGKSIAGSYEMALHLTGEYPDWWQGKRFAKPIKAWAAGLTSVKVRDSLQTELLGQIARDPTNKDGSQIIGIGTGMIPKDAIANTRPRAGIPDAIDTAYIRHKSGGISVLHFKSYDQGIDAFSAEAIEVVHLDEEPDKEIYVECAIRTMTNGGIVLITATPLLGMTELMVEAMEAYRSQPSYTTKSNAIYIVMASWDDAPHLTEEAKQDLESKIPAYQRDARKRGIPQVGAGAIYPIEESAIKIKPIEIPDHWPRAWAMDVGNNTAVLWLAHDREAGVWYVYREYFRSGGEEHIPPSTHAGVIKGAREETKWIPGVVDPAARGRSQTDGQRLLQMYQDLGLDVEPSNNAVEAGIQEVFDAFCTGRLKVFETLHFFWEEFRLYARDKNGKIVKKRDHLMDACFAPSTLVLTDRGPATLQELAESRPSGCVLSRDGVWAHYHSARKTRGNAQTVTVRFDDGSSVQCTPDHRFLAADGWIKALDLAGRYCYHRVSQSVQSSTERGPARSWCQRLFRSFRESVTICVASIFSAPASASIVGFGRLATEECRSPRDTTSTTKTPTAQITNPTIWNSSPSAITPTITSRATSGDVPPSQLKRPRNGTGPKPGRSGTAGITRTPKRSSTSWVLSCAINAASLSSEQSTGIPDSAPTNAKVRFAELLASTIYNVVAWFAARLSAAIDIIRGHAARRNAKLLCVSVENSGKQSDVYCLTVPGIRAFCLENGVVVHNCRYGWLSGRDRARTRPAPKHTAKLNQQDPGSWMGA